MKWFWRLLPIIPVGIAAIAFVVFVYQEPNQVAVEAPPALDITEVPSSRLERILATSGDDPAFAEEIPGILLVLAERHFTDGNYDLAFGRYAEVLEHPRSRRPQFAVALSRVAWIGWLSTGDTDGALASIDEALSIAPDNSETYYIKGQILWCGEGDNAGAVALFRRVLQAPDLPDAVHSQVVDDLEAAEAGQPCR